MINKTVKNNIYSILLLVIPTFIGLLLSFMFSLMLPGEPAIAYLKYHGFQAPSPADILNARQALGLDLPLVVQFFRYVFGFFTGDLGVSVTYTDSTVFEVLVDRIPVSLSFTILPIILGIFIGIVLGIVSIKTRYKFIEVFIQLLIILGISMPIFFIGLNLLYFVGYRMDLFPLIGDPILPSCILFLLTISLTTRQVRSNILNRSEEKHMFSYNIKIIINLSILITSIFLLEYIFDLHGFFCLFIDSIQIIDYWVIRVGTFFLIMLPVTILFFLNRIYTIYNSILEEHQSSTFSKFFGDPERFSEKKMRYTVDSEQRIKQFMLYRLKSPFTMVGLVIVSFFVIVAIFPQILTPLSYEQAIGIYAGPWDPPSGTNPLGQTLLGRDVLALLVYGISISLTTVIIPVLIGIIVGSLIGYLCKIHKWIKGSILGLLILGFIIPCILLIFLFHPILGRDIAIFMTIMTVFMVPWVTVIISNGNYSFKLTAMKLFIYFPIFIAFNIMIFEAIGFLGFSDPLFEAAQLGTSVGTARNMMYYYPWAYFWPGLALNILVIGFVMLHYGLKEPIPINLRRTSKF